MTDTCAICHKPVQAGDARYTVGELKDPPVFQHYDCWKRKMDKLCADAERSGPEGKAIVGLFNKMRGK